MNEQTTPAAPGVEQQPASVEDRLVAFYAKSAPRKTAPAEPAAPATEPEEQAPEAADEQEQPQAQAAPDDLTPEDLPDDDTAEATPPSGSDVFEFDAAGERLKVTRDEVIKLAQQGHDYTRKTQALADKARDVEVRLQRVTAVEQVAPQLRQAHAEATALATQLQTFDANIEKAGGWVALATNDPLEYSKVRAQYDMLAQSFQRASGSYHQLKGAIDQQTQALRQQTLAAESQNLVKRIPEWSDPEKFKNGAQRLREYLVAEGATSEEVDGLTSSLAVAIAYKAMRYDDLVKSKQAKTKQLRSAPPVTKPGAAQTPQSAAQRQFNEARKALRQSGDWRDAATLLAKMK